MSHLSKDRVSRINLSATGRGLLMAGAAALATSAVVRRGIAARVLLAIAAGALAYKGVSGHSTTYRLLGIRPVHRGRHREQGTLYVTHTITIARSPAELYAMWRDVSRLPQIFPHVEQVEPIDDRRSHWKAQGAFGATFEWDSEITLDLPDQELRWRSLPGAQVGHRGIVRFERAPADRGTVLRVQMIYDPPGGKWGAVLARLLGDDPHGQLKTDLARLKQRLETGEVATTHGQSSGRR